MRNPFKREPELRVKLAKPIFGEDEKAILITFLESPVAKKFFKYLVAHLLSLMWDHTVSEDFKSGWQECINSIKGIPTNISGEGSEYIGEDSQWNDVN